MYYVHSASSNISAEPFCSVTLDSCKTTALMKSTNVQTLGAVALHATTAYTDEASIVGLGPLNW